MYNEITTCFLVAVVVVVVVVVVVLVVVVVVVVAVVVTSNFLYSNICLMCLVHGKHSNKTHKTKK